MVIRCERCSTLYELDEALLAPEGSQVQCTKCQQVFVACPPRAAGSAHPGMHAEPGAPAVPVDAADTADPQEPAAAHQRESAGAAHGGAGRAGRRAPSERDHGQPHPAASDAHAAPHRVAWSSAPPVYRPAVPPPPMRAPVLRRDTVGAFEARLRWMSRWRWLAPSIAAALVVLVVAGVVLLRRRAEPTSARARGEALALVALDDGASVDDAIARLEGEVRNAPRDPAPAADRALAQVIRAAVVLDEGEFLAARGAGRSAERERLRRDQPEGWEEKERTAAADAHALDSEVRAREERARNLSRAALDTLRRLQRDAGDRIEVLRGLAAYYALGAERDRALRTVRAARERGAGDAWIDLAEAWTEARDADRAGRERALARLGGLSSSHPGLLRARWILARTQAALGRRGEALATVEGLLAANPRHEGAKRLKAELLAPPEALASVKPATPPRNPDSQAAAPVVRPPRPVRDAAARNPGPEGSAVPSGAPAGAVLTPAASPAEPAAPAPAAAPVGTLPDAGAAGPAGVLRSRASAPTKAPAAPQADGAEEPQQYEGG